MMRAAIAAAVSGIAVGAVLAAGVPLASTQGDASAVAIDNFTFRPRDLTVKVGTTVTWTNKDDIPHTVAAVDKLFRSKALDTNDNYSFTFMTRGTYAYFCSLHPHMTGTIMVEAAPGNDAGH
jgi:plastocyanin